MTALNEWATDPDGSHVAVTPDAADLEQLFADLAANISHPGATDIVIDEGLMPDFILVDILPPAKGTAFPLDARSLRWTIPQLGTTSSESAVLEFTIRHVTQTSGTKLVNQSITYGDTEGNQMTFPAPTVTVECNRMVCTEECPTPVDLAVTGCTDAVCVDLGDVYLESQGRIPQLGATIKHVCPGKRVALAVILTEVDSNGDEHQRGMKTLTVPAHDGPACRDVRIGCLKFVVPEDLDVSGNSPYSLCNPRRFQARLIAHYMDTEFRCCDASVTL